MNINTVEMMEREAALFMYLLRRFVLIEEKHPNATLLLRRRRNTCCTEELQVEARVHCGRPLKGAKESPTFRNLLN